MHHPTERITNTTAFVTPVVEHWLEREIAQWVHTMKDRHDDPSHQERMLLPRSYISLPHTMVTYELCFTVFCCQTVPTTPVSANTYPGNNAFLSNYLNVQCLGRKEMFYLTTLNTFYLRLYGIRHMVKDHTDTDRGNLLLPHRLLFSINSKDNTYHSLCYTSRGTLAGTRNSSIGPQWRIDPTTHRTISERSYHGATSRSQCLACWMFNDTPARKPINY